jgi:hypothetical protein
MVNVFAFLRIFVMSSGVESVSGEVGSVGTNGFDAVGDDAFGAGACLGDAAGAVAAMLREYNEENMSRKNEKENMICFIFGLMIGDYYEGINVNDWIFY